MFASAASFSASSDLAIKFALSTSLFALSISWLASSISNAISASFSPSFANGITILFASVSNLSFASFAFFFTCSNDNTSSFSIFLILLKKTCIKSPILRDASSFLSCAKLIIRVA